METEIIIVDPITKKVIRPEEVGFDYDPVQGDSNPGSNFAVDDIIGVTHNDVLDLEYSQTSNTITDSFTITEPTSYTSDDLKFGIQEIEAVQDYYQIENSTDYLVDQLSYYDNIQVAQGFEIKWDYAYFTGAKIYLDQVNLGPWGIYALDLLLVSAETSSPFEPNMSDILSSDINDPYNSANILPSSSIDNIHFYNFTDVVLSKGEYFIVANLSVVDTGDPGTYKHFAWHKKLGGDLGGNSFRKSYGSSSWTQIVNYDYNLIPQLLPSFSNGTAYKFTDPEVIDLRDNSNSVSSFSSSISTSGLHTITSNTSVQITLANPYTFKQTFSASSLFDVTNSTYWSYSATWNLTWSTSVVDISPYTNLDRNQLIYTPDDWHSSFTFYYNDTNTMPGSREVNGYELNLGSNDSAGNWLLITTSPNYLSNLELLDDTTPTERFLLGYWVGGATDSTGFVGSKVVANTLVQGDGSGTPYNETTGSLNYTLYDINGNIVPLKSSLPANLIYTDTTDYTLSGITQVSSGFYTPEIYFDPSASGSDLPGFWTAAVMWQNGTEVGFYSQRIIVQTQTELVLEWEEEPSNDIWITTDITRKGLDSILVRGSYYNISEPYTIGTKNLIPTAIVSYTVHNATWNKNDVFNDYAPDYNTSILIDANIDVGTYTIDFLGTGAFLENNSTSFTLTVFYELALVPEYTNYQTNYTNNVSYYLNLYDVTASANLSLDPDDMSVTINNGASYPLNSSIDYTFDYQASTEQWILNISTSTNSLDTGPYTVS
ncbi:MAG: hypothetical protein KAU62_10505, partial [Candidatus Heimdallarchaeota archaeon]|nr:hypothetical protein [Candidatus Heimdallarchaeota archaeon]MCK4611575.1 hypothetical protein [Candidatus Heimdallarchaeota archaeon]